MRPRRCGEPATFSPWVLFGGVTGLAQVLLPADTDLFSVRHKLAYDLHYVEHVSLHLDLRILLSTLLYALGAPARITRRLLGLAGSEQFLEVVPLNGAAELRQPA